MSPTPSTSPSPDEAVGSLTAEPTTAQHRRGWAAPAVGALGVVFGDIGTSPLYSLQTVFAIDHGVIAPTVDDIYSVVSAIFWSITLIVSVKYVIFILRADNDGEGGIMALAALVRNAAGARARWATFALGLGVLGASLFYGDSLITPAISVLSAVEGVEIVQPDLAEAVLPIGTVILALLFVVQRFGTHRVGGLFGPIMIVWFATITALGLPHIVHHPGVLLGLSPVYAATFVVQHPIAAFAGMGAVVLVITGAEALYADMGHFGRGPIRLAWFAIVFPALIVNYLGQAALVLDDPAAISNPFYLLAPAWGRLPLVVLATAATVIASQAVISGAFSMSKQAVRLGYLPPLTVRHTSNVEGGQIYVPAVNWLLFAGVLVLMAVFPASNKLATAYGVAVTGTLILTTTLFVMYAALAWQWGPWQLVAVAVIFGGSELTYFTANLAKIAEGGWLPIVVAAVVVTVMTTWQRGRRIMTTRRIDVEGSLPRFLDTLVAQNIPRVPGTAVFLHPTKETTPLALRANVAFNHVLHEHLVMVSVHSENVPYIAPEDRLEVEHLDDSHDGIIHVTARFGFQDRHDVPQILQLAHDQGEASGIDAADALYFLSQMTVERGSQPGMSQWRKRLFIGLAHNAASPAAGFHLPVERTVVMGSRVEL